jgi:hypothetical protein
MTRLHCAVTLTVAVVVGLGCTACAQDASSPAAAGSTRSSTASSPPRTSPAGDVPPPPKVGECRNTPPSNLDQHDWVDQTPAVDCSRPHTLETFGVIKPVEKLTLATAQQLADSCETLAVDYLGISSPEVRTLALPFAYWPSRAQRAAGQNWLRCDVGIQATTHCCRPRAQLAPQTTSLRGDVASDPVRFQMCIDQLPDPSRPQPLASCKKPHRTEVLPTGLAMDVTSYPSAAVLTAKGHAECADLVADRHDRARLVVTPVWQPEAYFSGVTLYGSCWIHHKTGLMPPIT